MSMPLRSCTALVLLWLFSLGAIGQPIQDTTVASDPTAETAVPFTERLAAQWAIEEVYWRHRSWPREDPYGKPPLREVMSEESVRSKVQDYLRGSKALAVLWERPLSSRQLQAEIDRMAARSKAPNLLRELFAALDHDPLLIAECLARPLLVSRLLRNWYEAERGTLPETGGERPTFDDWWSEQRSVFSPDLEVHDGDYRLPALGEGDCNEDSWRLLGGEQIPGAMNAPAVWTGSEMIVCCGKRGLSVTRGARYDPATDTWSATAAAPWSVSHQIVSVWTGTELLLWGGSGARYDPQTNSFTTISVENQPSARHWGYTAVWTGSEMIVWGGGNSETNEGARYDPDSDTWTPTSTLAAPDPRTRHSAVWTGEEMIVWGGETATGASQTGGRYDPISDTWLPVTTFEAPVARARGHSAIWTDEEMIVWGGAVSGSFFDHGGRYDPTSDSWSAISSAQSPTPRADHSAVWTGEEMIVWGGEDDLAQLNSGGRYDPSTDTWIPTADSGSPDPREDHAAIWTGNEMIVFGGQDGPYSTDLANTGGRYDPLSDSWVPTSSGQDRPPAGSQPKVWTGAEMLTKTHRYDPATDAFAPTSQVGAPATGAQAKAVWTGTLMLIWGGVDLSYGGRYDPQLDSWTPMSQTDQPSPRREFSAVWTGEELIIWAGRDWHSNWWEGVLSDGGRYDPETDSWSGMHWQSAPTMRHLHSAVWTGEKMIVWGGCCLCLHCDPWRDGAVYDPRTDRWESVSGSAGPARWRHYATWTGTQMIVIGGTMGSGDSEQPAPADIHRWTPLVGWTQTDPEGAPTSTDSDGVWTGNEIIFPKEQKRYDVADDSWTATSTTGLTEPLGMAQPVWTGREVLGWADDWWPVGSAYCGCSGGTVEFWHPDADGDGFGADSVSVPSCEEVPGHTTVDGDCADSDYAVYPGAADAVCNGVDDNCDELVDNEAQPLQDLSTIVAPHDDVEIVWDPVTGASGYNVVRGRLSILLGTEGDFTLATELCVADDHSATSVADDEPVPEHDGFWYLVRAVNCAGGTYESGGPSQSGQRDEEIAAAAVCP